jgi:HAD superfamily phosphatase
MTSAVGEQMWAMVVFDIDGVIRDVSQSYRRAIADTVERFTQSGLRPSLTDIDELKAEGVWNNDWLASQELIFRYFESQGILRSQVSLNYEALVDFFQSRYRGIEQQQHPSKWTGYITQEPLLLSTSYLETLTSAGIGWGFFSGATRGSASYVLQTRLGLSDPILVAMEDAPGKPDPTGLLVTVEKLEARHQIGAALPVLYVGDTVADLHTVQAATIQQPARSWIGIGVLPPHVQNTPDCRATYKTTLENAGARAVMDQVEQLRPDDIQRLIGSSSC